jgi:flagellar FliL protein
VLFNRKAGGAPAKKATDEGPGAPPDEKPEGEEAAEVAETPAPPPPQKTPGGLLGLLAVVGIMTVVAGGMGVGLGMWTASKIEKTIAKREAAQPVEEHKVSIKYSGDMVLQHIEPVVANLASPTDTWVRLETAMIFKNGAIANPEVTAAELRQDILAFIRTVKLAQLEGPSALQHLREDLNERVQLRTDNQVSELVIQTLVVQ